MTNTMERSMQIDYSTCHYESTPAITRLAKWANVFPTLYVGLALEKKRCSLTPHNQHTTADKFLSNSGNYPIPMTRILNSNPPNSPPHSPIDSPCASSCPCCWSQMAAQSRRERPSILRPSPPHPLLHPSLSWSSDREQRDSHTPGGENNVRKYSYA